MNIPNALTLLRIVLIPVFIIVFYLPVSWNHPAACLVFTLAALTDLLDGWLARRLGPSKLGVFLDPVADKIFMAAAFWVVLMSGRLEPYEIIAVLLRDIVAVFAFLATMRAGLPSSIPARAGGKAVTVAQNLTLLAFVLGSELLRPMAWATGAIAIYAIWDCVQARGARRTVGA